VIAGNLSGSEPIIRWVIPDDSGPVLPGFGRLVRPIFEYLGSIGFTERRGDVRVLVKDHGPRSICGESRS